MDGSARKFFTEEQIMRIEGAIEMAEDQTSGEIRVHLEEKCSRKNVLERAAEIFARLKMHKTDQRNGVLIYLAFADKRFAIIGDKGINQVVEPDFWNSTRDVMQEHFRHNQFVDGLCHGISSAGSKLKMYFPYQKEDENELKDDISFGN
jgi:uncharacterized membrane protein